MRYYKLIYDYQNDKNCVNCIEGNIGNMNKYIIVNGKWIDEWESAIFKYKETEGHILTDYLANLYGWLIVSNNFIDKAAAYVGRQVQYLPVKVVNITNKVEINSYRAANIINTIDALDLENSRYDIFELGDEKILSIEKYALKKKALEGNHIFRLKGESIPVFVSEKLKKIVEENRLTGFDFLEVSADGNGEQGE